jgi:hypothetical protein
MWNLGGGVPKFLKSLGHDWYYDDGLRIISSDGVDIRVDIYLIHGVDCGGLRV